MDFPTALVVEDEPLIAMDISSRIEAAGWRVLGPTASVAQTLLLLEAETPQMAFIDIQLYDENSSAIVMRLRELAVPIVLTTAYQSPAAAGAAFAGLPTLVKPFDLRVLQAIVDRRRGVSYHIDHERRIVFLYGRGALRIEDVLDLQSRLHADPAFDPSYRLLADYRAAISFQVDTKRLDDVVRNAPFARVARRAFVVRGSENYGVMQAFKAVNDSGRDHGEVGVFYDFDSASRWLEEA